MAAAALRRFTAEFPGGPALCRGEQATCAEARGHTRAESAYTLSNSQTDRLIRAVNYRSPAWRSLSIAFRSCGSSFSGSLSDGRWLRRSTPHVSSFEHSRQSFRGPRAFSCASRCVTVPSSDCSTYRSSSAVEAGAHSQLITSKELLSTLALLSPRSARLPEFVSVPGTDGKVAYGGSPSPSLVPTAAKQEADPLRALSLLSLPHIAFPFLPAGVFPTLAEACFPACSHRFSLGATPPFLGTTSQGEAENPDRCAPSVADCIGHLSEAVSCSDRKRKILNGTEYIRRKSAHRGRIKRGSQAPAYKR